uniref:Uncharacterized protein n=1 Tax=Cacopsylla melanoneura TaxID=428564 RepID=A0A8D8RR49_9HEMI
MFRIDNGAYFTRTIAGPVRGHYVYLALTRVHPPRIIFVRGRQRLSRFPLALVLFRQQNIVNIICPIMDMSLSIAWVRVSLRLRRTVVWGHGELSVHSPHQSFVVVDEFLDFVYWVSAPCCRTIELVVSFYTGWSSDEISFDFIS